MRGEMIMESQKKKRSVWKKILLGIVSFLLLVIISGFAFEAVAGYQGVKKYPPSGKLVDVGEFKLHIQKQGKGKPTVIFETGSRASSTSWGDIPEELSKFATVVTYDRGGYAWSDKPKTERTGENIVKELYTALKKENIEGPYIIVGHSLGGMYARLFAQTYYDEMAGVILLDARPEDYSKETDDILRKNDIDPVLMGSPSKHMMSLLKQTGFIRLMGESILTEVPEEHRNRAMNIEFRAKYFHALEDELRNMSKLEDLIREQSLGNIPLTVVTHGIPLDGSMLGLSKEDDHKMEEIWQDQQRKMLKLSTNSQFVVAENSGHGIMIEEPELVINVVKEMLELIKE